MAPFWAVGDDQVEVTANGGLVRVPSSTGLEIPCHAYTRWLDLCGTNQTDNGGFVLVGAGPHLFVFGVAFCRWEFIFFSLQTSLAFWGQCALANFYTRMSSNPTSFTIIIHHGASRPEREAFCGDGFGFFTLPVISLSSWLLTKKKDAPAFYWFRVSLRTPSFWTVFNNNRAHRIRDGAG